MDLLIPNRSGEFPDITKPLELAKQLQDRVILIEDFDSKADVANEVLDGLNKHWRHKGKHIVIGDSLIGPTQDPADSAPFEHYRLVEGERLGFSWVFAKLDLGENLYIKLVVLNTEQKDISVFERDIRRRQFHAPVIDNPWYEVFEEAP